MCRAMTCDPACPAGYDCVETNGKMACRPKCEPACAKGMACDYTASPPACVLPNPQDFTLLISIATRYQIGEEVGSFYDMDTPVGFLGTYVSGEPTNACPLLACKKEHAGEDLDAIDEACYGDDDYSFFADSYSKAPYMEAFNVEAKWNDSRGEYEYLARTWREVHVDVGAALADGKWAGSSAAVSLYASSLDIEGVDGQNLPAGRPLDVTVAFRHKATGATFAESQVGVGTLVVPFPDIPDGLCFHGRNALSLVVRVSTNAAKDQLAYSLNIVKPADPGAPFVAPPAAAAADAAEVEGYEEGDGPLGLEMTPKVRARLDAALKRRAERREAIKKRRNGGFDGPGPAASSALGARRRR